MWDCPLSKMTQLIGEGEEYKKVVSGGEDMTQIRGNAADWYAGDNTEYVKPTGITHYEKREGYEGKEERIKNGEEIKFSVEIEGRMSRISAEYKGEKVETRWTTKAILQWYYHDHERLHQEQYKLAQQLAGEEYAIVGTGNRLFIKRAPPQEWKKWQRKQPEEAIVLIDFGKITGTNGDRLIRGHARVRDEEEEIAHISEVYEQVTPNRGSERMRLLKLAKAEMEKKMKCNLCDRGQVFFKSAKKMPDKEFARVFEKFCLYGYDPKVVYLATWYPVELNKYGLCDKCFVHEQVWRNSTVETDISTEENVMLKDQLDAEDEIDPLVRGEVTYKKQETTLDRLVHVEDRLNAYEDIEFIASLDRHETNKFLGSGSAECKNESFLWAAANTTKQELEAY